MVPRAPIAEAIRRYIEAEKALQPGEATNDLTPPLVALAMRAHVSPGTIDNLLKEGRGKYVGFNTADRLLCGANLVHLWWGELNDIYLAVDLSALSPAEARWWEPEFDTRVCPECDEEFTVLLNANRGGDDKVRTYCSVECGGAVGGRASWLGVRAVAA